MLNIIPLKPLKMTFWKLYFQRLNIHQSQSWEKTFWVLHICSIRLCGCGLIWFHWKWLLIKPQILSLTVTLEDVMSPFFFSNWALSISNRKWCSSQTTCRWNLAREQTGIEVKWLLVWHAATKLISFYELSSETHKVKWVRIIDAASVPWWCFYLLAVIKYSCLQ